MRILLVEDEEEIALFTQKGLEAELFTVDVASDGLQGEKLALINEYDALVLDHNLPGKTGIEICESLRKQGKKYPILMLTAETGVESKIKAFNCGASGYLTKPFAIEELVARLRAMTNQDLKTNEAVLTCKGVNMDVKRHTASRDGKPLKLRKKEYELLEYLLRNPDTVLTRSMILEHVWDTNADPFTNTVDVHIRLLRQRLNDGYETKLIDTIRGVGYRL